MYKNHFISTYPQQQPEIEIWKYRLSWHLIYETLSYSKTTDMKDLYTENQRTLLREVKEYPPKWRITPC